MKEMLFLMAALLAVSRVALGMETQGADQRGEDSDSRSNEARLVAAYSTRTVYTLTTTTATVFTTCQLQGGGTNICQRRRVKRFHNRVHLDDNNDSSFLELEGALQEVPEVARIKREADDDEDKAREGRIALTVWTTTSSTFTVTSTSTDTATTFSVSYYCTVLGSNMASACG